MKLENKNTTVIDSFGLAKEAKIDQANLGKLWTMLQSPYKNPIGSIVREITSNCFDAHKDAGVNDAVIIQFSKDDNGIKINFKDVGTGMTPEVIENIYLSYLSSTKDKSNDFIGAFGIGSKSPLSYVDVFYIDTRVDGKEWNYMMSKGESSPEIILLSESDTKERNGTTISFYLKEWKVNGDNYNSSVGNDFSAFIKEIHRQLFYFNNVYVVIDEEIKNYYSLYGYGAKNDFRVHERLIAEINDCKVYEHDLFYVRPHGTKPYNDVHICLGPVTYPIDWNQLPGCYSSNYPYSIALKFNIGELPVIQTREDLNYGKKATIDTIIAKLNEVEALFTEEQKNKFDVCVDDFSEYLKLENESKNTNFSFVLSAKQNIIFNIPSKGYKPTWKPLKDRDISFRVIGGLSNVRNNLLRNSISYYKTITNSGSISTRHSPYWEMDLRRLDFGFIDNIKNIKNKGTFLLEKDETYNVSKNKFIASPEGLNKALPTLWRKRELNLNWFKSVLKLTLIPKNKWRDYIEVALLLMKDFENTFDNYKDVVITADYKKYLAANKKIKAVNETLLLTEIGYYNNGKIYKTPSDIEKESTKNLYVYCKAEEEIEFKNIISNVESDRLITPISVELKDLVQFNNVDYSKNVKLVYQFDHIFRLHKKERQNFKIRFIKIANTKAKKLKKVKGAIHFKEYFKKMNVIKKLGNFYYFQKKLLSLKNKIIATHNEDKAGTKFFAFIKIINNDLWESYSNLNVKMEKLYSSSDVVSKNSAFQEEMINLCKENKLLDQKEIDDIFDSLIKYNNFFIDIENQSVDSLSNIVYFLKINKLPISKKYYMKYNRQELVNIINSKEVNDIVLQSYLKKFSSNKLDNVYPNQENLNKIITF